MLGYLKYFAFPQKYSSRTLPWYQTSKAKKSTPDTITTAVHKTPVFLLTLDSSPRYY